MLGMLTLVILLSFVAPANAQESGGVPGGIAPTAPSRQLGPTTPAEVEAFMDDLLAQEMEETT